MDGDSERESLFGQSMTFEEIEAQAAEPEDKGKGGEGGDDDLPDAYKGMSAKQIAAIAETSREAMKSMERSSSESARVAAELADSSRRAPPPPSEEVKELTREELQELYDKDPLEAIAKIEEQAMRRISAHVESRIAPLTSGTMSSAENWAKEEFPDEFELFASDIKKLVDSVPNKSVFTSKQGWEDAVAYVRGQKNNFEKLVTHRATKADRDALANARGRERESTGFNARSRSTNEARGAADKEIANKMGDEQRQIAQRFIDDGVFKSFSEYNKWYSRQEA